MTENEAVELLRASEALPVVQAPIPDAKRLLEQCLAADIPAALGRDDSCKTGGCTPKIQLFVRREDIPRLATMMQSDWISMVESEGYAVAHGPADVDLETGEPPCPACGTAAPLVAGACSDCGLQLA